MPTYNLKEKLQILELYVRGGQAAVAQVYPAVSKSSIQRWCRIYEKEFTQLLQHWKIPDNRILSRGHTVKFLSHISPTPFELFEQGYQELLSRCCLWTAGVDSDNYGRFRVGKKRYYAHYLSFTLFTKSKHTSNHNNVLLHSCDNPSCTNPYHLQLGTHSSNMMDMKLKGRAKYFGDTSILQKANEFSKLFDD